MADAGVSVPQERVTRGEAWEDVPVREVLRPDAVREPSWSELFADTAAFEDPLPRRRRITRDDAPVRATRTDPNRARTTDRPNGTARTSRANGNGRRAPANGTGRRAPTNGNGRATRANANGRPAAANGNARAAGSAVPGRRTVTIRGHGAERNMGMASQRSGRPTRRAYERAGFKPDRVAMWAVFLGVLLIVVAATSAHP